MDIARPEFKAQKRRRQIAVGAAAVVVVAAITVGVFRLRPAAPTVERGTVWTDSVKRGSMLRQVRGIGSLVPSQESVLQIPAETEATVLRIRMLPGSQVKADTILMDMSNPQVEQAAVDANLQYKAAEAEYQSQRVTRAGQGLLLHQELLARGLPLLLRNDRRCFHCATSFCMFLVRRHFYFSLSRLFEVGAISSSAFFLRETFTAKAARPPVETAPATTNPIVAKQNGHIVYLLSGQLDRYAASIGMTGGMRLFRQGNKKFSTAGKPIPSLPLVG
jgi:hypothetical protein